MKKVKYQLIIGLEVHVELKTKSKMFCGCSADYFGKEPNTHVCPVCLGLPGALPVPNKTAIEWCVMIGLALNCEIPLFSKFDRKNYFYPDLPKGYQISQYDQPFAVNGLVNIKSEIRNPKSETNSNDKNTKTIRIRRVHMEEDTAKLVHQFGAQSARLQLPSRQYRDGGQAKRKAQNSEGFSLIDFNRSGVPLVEIVTEPDFESATEVVEYLKKLQQIVRYLDVSNADMEKGEMRLEPNVSLRSRNTTNTTNKQILPIYKVEVKNINSFRFVEKAINYEVERQKAILESGKTPVQETRGWDEKKGITVTQRVKEEAMDYRYFPEPDIPPIRWSQSQISKIKTQIPELPDKRSLRFQKEYSLSTYDSEILTKDKQTANYFEEAVRVGKTHNTSPKQISNVIINKKIDIDTILPAQLIQNILISMQTATINEKELKKIVKEILGKNQKAVEDYKKGKVQVIGFLIGQVKQTIKLSLDTEKVKKVIEKVLKTY